MATGPVGNPMITQQQLNPASMAATPLAPPETLPTYKTDQLLNIGSSSGNFANSFNDDLTIVPDAVKSSYYRINPTSVPNGSNVLFNFRTMSWHNPSESTITIPFQFSFWNMVAPAAHTQVTGANASTALNALAYNSVTTDAFDTLWNKPFAEWARCITTFQCRVGNSNVMVQQYSNDQYPNISSSVFLPSQREPLDSLHSNLYLGNARNSRNANVTVFTPPSTLTVYANQVQDFKDQVDQQVLLSDAIPRLQNAFLNDMLRSAINNTPFEITFPLKMFMNMFNCTKATVFPPNFSYSYFINFNTQPFLVRAWGDLGLKAQVVLTSPANISLPFITMNKLEFSAEGTQALNLRLTSKFINHNFLETKSIPPSNPNIPIGSNSWTSQLTIASIRPMAYAIYFIVPNVTDGIVYAPAGNRLVQDFSQSPSPMIYPTMINLTIGGVQTVYMDRQNSGLNYNWVTRDAEDIQQSKINQRFMDYSSFHNHTSKSVDMGIPWIFVIDPANYVSENQIGSVQGPVTTQITVNFQEYNRFTNTLGPASRAYQAVCVEILHSQFMILPTLDLVQVPISSKLSGQAPSTQQAFSNRAVAV